MKVLLEQSGYELTNLGDLAMLQFTVERIHRRWPGADISVLTTMNRPIDDLVRWAKPVMVSGRDAVLSQHRLLGTVNRRLSFIDKGMWRHFPSVTERMMTLKARLGKKHYPNVLHFRKAVMEADCVVASGGGFINDEFPDMVGGVCSTLAMAQRYGKPTAMFGQGLGPIENPYLLRMAKGTMKNLMTLGLRESVFSPKVAAKLDVPQDRISLTGDNATFFALSKAKPGLGNAIGINVRVAGYSRVGDSELAMLREQVKTAAERLNATLHPILICKFHKDDERTKALCPAEYLQQLPMDTPEDIIDAISKCRIVITGSYHAAVFALSQGIPVIGLAVSPYYQTKFEGLRGHYPEGMRVVMLSELTQPGALADLAAEFYEKAPVLRESLLDTSTKIVEKIEHTYDGFFTKVERAARGTGLACCFLTGMYAMACNAWRWWNAAVLV